MKNISLLFSIAFVFLFCITCKKDRPPKVLPPITQTGANTFGCKINGQVWVPYYPCIDASWNGAVELAYNIHPIYSTSMFPLRFSLEAGKLEDPYSEFFSIGPAHWRGLNTEDLSYVYRVGNVFDSLEIDFTTNSGYYTPKYGNPNNVFQITKIDTASKIISGIFSFTVYDYFGTNFLEDSLVVTDGRFDLHIGQYSHCTN